MYIGHVSSGNVYYLATRCVNIINIESLEKSWAEFGIYRVAFSNIYYNDLFTSDNDGMRVFEQQSCIRPVVRIPNNVKFVINKEGEYDLLYPDNTTTANQQYDEQKQEDDRFWEKYDVSEDNGIKFATDQLDISFNDNISSEKCESILKEINVKNYYNYSNGILNTYIVQIDKEYDKLKDIKDYAFTLKEKYKEIESVTPNYIMNISAD